MDASHFIYVIAPKPEVNFVEMYSSTLIAKNDEEAWEIAEKDGSDKGDFMIRFKTPTIENESRLIWGFSSIEEGE